jgi:hypothetical protein
MMNILTNHRSGLLAGIMLALAHQAPATDSVDSFARSFKKFANAAPGVDIYAGNRADAANLEKPLGDMRAKLVAFLGEPIARGAIVVCTSLEQKDSVTERRVLRMGYRWALIQLTAEATNQQMLAQVKSQMGGQLPPGMLERLQSPTPEMKAASDARLVSSTVQRAASAMIFTTLAPEKEFRASRLEDPGRSPLADWLDIALAAHSAGTARSNLRLLQERLDEGFPLEDVLTMSRPFVPPSTGGAPGGGPFLIRMPGPGAAGGAGPAPGPGPQAQAAMNRSVSMPKDVADRMMFDAQSAAFFGYVLEKAGMEKAKALVQWNREGKPVRDFVARAEVLGSDLDTIEKEWQDWIKAQKADPPIGMRIVAPPGGGARPPSPEKRP